MKCHQFHLRFPNPPLGFVVISPTDIEFPLSIPLVFVLLAPALAPQVLAEPPANYYAQAYQTGAVLRTALHNTIKAGHTPSQYSATTEQLKLTDQDPANPNNVILIYSRRSELKTNYITTGIGTAAWNKEHLWPNSLGIDAVVPMYSDLFNLRPADVDVNATRGNLWFDESSVAEGRIVPGDGEAPLTSRDSNSWEPPAIVKGDIARSCFYMDVRYEGDPGETNLQLSDNLGLITGTSTYMGKLTTLLLWHLWDPVSPEERQRNDSVFAKQKNRNPFIDNPAWVTQVYGDPLELKLIRVNAIQWTLRWWAELPGAVPEMSTSLSPAWIPITSPPALSVPYKTITLTLPASCYFFRLRYTPPDVP